MSLEARISRRSAGRLLTSVLRGVAMLVGRMVMMLDVVVNLETPLLGTVPVDV
jgi:hypothetical protein